jgi:uncharacterized protein (DUF342 family)
MVKKRTKKETPPAAVVKPIGTPLQAMRAEQSETIGVHPVVRERLAQYDAAIKQNEQAIKDAQALIKSLAFAKNEVLRLEISKEGFAVATTKPAIVCADDYSTVQFWTPMQRIEPTV